MSKQTPGQKLFALRRLMPKHIKKSNLILVMSESFFLDWCEYFQSRTTVHGDGPVGQYEQWLKQPVWNGIDVLVIDEPNDIYYVTIGVKDGQDIE